METSAPIKGGEPKPSPAELEGRLVALIPVREDAYREDGKPDRPMIVADVVVMGYGPFDYGATEGKMATARPAQRRVNLPYWIDEATFGQQELMRAMRPKISAERRKAVVGRIVRGTGGTKGSQPWMVAEPTPEEMAAVNAYFAQAEAAQRTGSWVQPEPLEINQDATPAQAAQYQPAPVQQPPAQAVYQPAATQSAYSPAPGAQPQYTSAPAAAVVADPNRPADIPEAVWVAMPPDARAALLASRQPAQPQFDLNTPVAGLEAAWPHMPPEARQQAWAATQGARY